MYNYVNDLSSSNCQLWCYNKNWHESPRLIWLKHTGVCGVPGQKFCPLFLESTKLFCQMESSMNLGKRVAWYLILGAMDGNSWSWLVWGYNQPSERFDLSHTIPLECNTCRRSLVLYSIMHLQLELENISQIELVCDHYKINWMYLSSGQPLLLCIVSQKGKWSKL